jgi:hypothetical protein
VVGVLVIGMNMAVVGLISRPELQLVTGDREPIRSASMAGRALSPADFIATR